MRTAATYMAFINHFCLRFCFILLGSTARISESASCLRNVLNIIDFFLCFSKQIYFLLDVYMDGCVYGGSGDSEDVLNLLLICFLLTFTPCIYCSNQLSIYLVMQKATFNLHQFNQLRIHTQASETESI